MNKQRIILRIITLPIMSIAILFAMLYHWVILTRKWIMYGGEIVAYRDKEGTKGVNDLYRLIDERLKETK